MPNCYPNWLTSFVLGPYYRDDVIQLFVWYLYLLRDRGGSASSRHQSSVYVSRAKTTRHSLQFLSDGLHFDH